MNAVGKEQIRKAFEAVAVHFEHSLDIKQAGMKILETDDTALVLLKQLFWQTMCLSLNEKQPTFLKEIKTILRHVRLIFPMAMTYLKKMPDNKINMDKIKRRSFLAMFYFASY